MAVGESLVREIARLRQEIESRLASLSEMQEVRAETETAQTLEVSFHTKTVGKRLWYYDKLVAVAVASYERKKEN